MKKTLLPFNLNYVSGGKTFNLTNSAFIFGTGIG